MAGTHSIQKPTAEAFVPLGKPASIDREKGIVYGIRIINPTSKNGNTYPSAVLDRSKSLYEGAKVNLNHSKNTNDDVSVESRFGRLQNVRVSESGGLEGDLRYNPKHPFASQFEWAVENQPDLYGFSHYSRVNWRVNGGEKVAESIVYVYHVDLVADPATTSGVFESENKTMTDPKEIAATMTDAAAFTKFLSDLFAALPASIDMAAKKAAVESLVASMDNVDVSAATESVAIEALKRLGKTGKWAADVVESIRREEATKARRQKAVEMCKAERLPETLMTDLFVELVAESIDNSTRAKSLIEDRKKFNTPASGGGAPISPPPPPPNRKSAKDLVGEFNR